MVLVVSDGIVEFTYGWYESDLVEIVLVVVSIVGVVVAVSVIALKGLEVVFRLLVSLSSFLIWLVERLFVMPVLGVINGLIIFLVLVVITVYFDDWLLNSLEGTHGVLIVV